MLGFDVLYHIKENGVKFVKGFMIPHFDTKDISRVLNLKLF